MKRDMALIRRILELIESSDRPVSVCDMLKSISVEGVSRHIDLLKRSGLLTHGLGRGEHQLTWQGHDWLDEQRAKDIGKDIEIDEELMSEQIKEETKKREQMVRSELLPHELDEQGVCKWCDKRVLKPEMNEVCRRRRGEDKWEDVLNAPRIKSDKTLRQRIEELPEEFKP